MGFHTKVSVYEAKKERKANCGEACGYLIALR